MTFLVRTGGSSEKGGEGEQIGEGDRVVPGAEEEGVAEAGGRHTGDFLHLGLVESLIHALTFLRPQRYSRHIPPPEDICVSPLRSNMADTKKIVKTTGRKRKSCEVEVSMCILVLLMMWVLPPCWSPNLCKIHSSFL